MIGIREASMSGLGVILICTGGVSGSARLNEVIVTTPTELKWVPAEAAPPGATLTVIEGSPKKPGVLTMRMRFPANYVMPPHWHSEVERVTVISGSLNWGVGDVMNRGATRHLPAGSVIVMPARLHHYAWTNEETVFQLNVLGPRTVSYVNPEEDPAHKGTVDSPR